jgi:hypothetical protein
MNNLVDVKIALADNFGGTAIIEIESKEQEPGWNQPGFSLGRQVSQTMALLLSN